MFGRLLGSVAASLGCAVLVAPACLDLSDAPDEAKDFSNPLCATGYHIAGGSTFCESGIDRYFCAKD